MVNDRGKLPHLVWRSSLVSGWIIEGGNCLFTAVKRIPVLINGVLCVFPNVFVSCPFDEPYPKLVERITSYLLWTYQVVWAYPRHVKHRQGTFFSFLVPVDSWHTRQTNPWLSFPGLALYWVSSFHTLAVVDIKGPCWAFVVWRIWEDTLVCPGNVDVLDRVTYAGFSKNNLNSRSIHMHVTPPV